MADLTIQQLGTNGGPNDGALTLETPNAGGDRFANDGNTFLLVEFGGAATGDVQVEGVPNSDAGRDGSSLIATAVSVIKVAGPFKPRPWNNGANVDLTYPSGVTGVTLAAIRVNRAG